MQLVSLNIWGARVHSDLATFVQKTKKTTDIFCFQEVYHTDSNNSFGRTNPPPRYDSLKLLAEALGEEFTCLYAPAQMSFDDMGKVDFHLEYGNAIFIRRNIEILEQDEVFVYGSRNARKNEEDAQPRSIQIVRLNSENGPITVINFHGLWQAGTNKADIPERIEQSHRLKEVIDRYDGPVVLCGDFNLLPEGQSITILEKGMRNLIKEYQVTSTRSSYYPKPIRLADYILVTPDLQIIDFNVLPDEVSDHLPLTLTWQ